MHRNRNRIVTAEKSATYFPERIAAYSLKRVNESQTLTANHRRENLYLHLAKNL